MKIVEFAYSVNPDLAQLIYYQDLPGTVHVHCLVFEFSISYHFFNFTEVHFLTLKALKSRTVLSFFFLFFFVLT